MAKFYRDTWVEIELDALAHNYQQFVQLRPHQDMFAVIKANAYGHGDVQVARLLSKLGAAYLAVSSLDEAIGLRKANIRTPIIVLAPVKISDVNVAAEFDITIVAYDEQWVTKLAEVQVFKPLKLHLEVETGMNRIGLRKVRESYDMLSELAYVTVEGIYTHMSSADSDLDSVAHQLDAFRRIIESFKPGIFKYIHVANTATTMQFDLPDINGQRVGIGLYGINPDESFVKTGLNLLPAFSFYTRLTQVSYVEKGAGVSYGSTFVATCDMYVGTMSVGYADGWHRGHQGRSVVINGYECEIIGRICMDQMMVKLPSGDFKVGDVVTLIGKALPVNRVADELGTIPYEVLTLINDRVPRIYLKAGKMVEKNRGRFE